MPDEEAVAVCMPTTMAGPDRVISGAMRKHCSECQQEVWISPATFAVTTRIVCIPCAMKKDLRGAEFAIHAEQIKELKSEQWNRKFGTSDKSSN